MENKILQAYEVLKAKDLTDHAAVKLSRRFNVSKEFVESVIGRKA